MSNDAVVFLFIFLAILLGCMIGGVFLKITKGVFRNNDSYVTLLSGGLLGGLLFFELIPETLEEYNFMGIVTGFTIGIIMMLFVKRFFHQDHIWSSKITKSTFFFLFISLLIHSLPTGMALGLNIEGDHSFSLLFAILIHQVPEGAALMGAAMSSKLEFEIFVLFSVLIAAIFAATTYAAMNIHIHSIKLDTLFMGMAIGTLAYVAFIEILYKGLKEITLQSLIIILLGVFMIKVYFFFV
ncbi:ZIP family metal transporter [Metabacillus idriensis]|uniref:ZIP family metal transporter n=1 Tax=Metabacillus idriensis TaxID=324768 RepID=UPI002813912B|nr:ZIP family metal transporter [Metabacillus idriensis]MDR0138694.1 ZIP family metal transporter [Metabacillus idriensis]